MENQIINNMGEDTDLVEIDLWPSIVGGKEGIFSRHEIKHFERKMVLPEMHGPIGEQIPLFPNKI